MNKINSVSLLHFLSAALLCVYPIATIYLLPIGNTINYGYIVLGLIVLINVLFNKQRLRIDLHLIILPFILLPFVFISDFAYYNDFSHFLKSAVDLIYHFLVVSLICGSKMIQRKKLYYTHAVFSCIAIGFALVQLLAHRMFGVNIPGIIPFLHPSHNQSLWMVSIGRVPSFFSEPAHYAIYLCPFLFFSLSWKKIPFAIVASIGLITTLSATGIALLLFVWLLHFALRLYKKTRVGFGVFLLCLVLAVPFVLLIIPLLPNGQIKTQLQKFSFENLMNNERAFSTLRYFQYFSFPNWLTGIGYNRLGDWGNLYNLSGLNNYAPSPLYCVFSFGLLGAASLLWLYLFAFKNSSVTNRCFLIMMLIIMMSDQMIFVYTFFFLLCYAESGFYKRALWGGIVVTDRGPYSLKGVYCL